MRILTILLLMVAPCFAGYQNFLGNSGVIDPFILNNTIRDLYKTKLDISSASDIYVKKTDIGSIYAVVLTTNTGGVEGDQTIVAHGVTFSKIVGWTAVLFLDSSNGRAPNVSGYGINYRVSAGTTYISINLHDTDSENILNKQVKITVFYTE